MKNLSILTVSTLSNATTKFTAKFIGALILPLVFSAGCADEMDDGEDADLIEDSETADFIEGNYEIENADELVLPPQYENGEQANAGHIGLPELGDDSEYDITDPFVRECNVCVRAPDGAICTLQACDDIDDRSGATCDGHGQGEVWAQDCNLCTCTGEGTVCTVNACISDLN